MTVSLDRRTFCAYSSPVGEDGVSLEDAAFAPEALAQEDCARFQAENAADLEQVDAVAAGHDFWLTRNRHGAGFWDRGLGELGKRLTDAAHAYGEADLYLGDDGLIHHS